MHRKQFFILSSISIEIHPFIWYNISNIERELEDKSWKRIYLWKAVRMNLKF